MFTSLCVGGRQHARADALGADLQRYAYFHYAQTRIYVRRQLETDVDFALKIHLRVKLRLFTKIRKSAVRVVDKARRLVEIHLAVERSGNLRLKLYLYRDE